LGPEYSFSDLLVRKLYPDAEVEHLNNLSKLVEKSRDGCAVVPSENSIAGPVGEVIRKIRDVNNIFITREIYYPIKLCLGGLGSEKDIEVIYSHPKAIQQCGDYLSEIGAKVKAVESTSEAAKTAKKYGKKAGVICAEDAIKKYQLNLLKENVQDNLNNYTIFWELSNKEAEIDNNKRIGTALIVDLENKVGALYKFLEIFYEEGVNLYFINSWPENGEYWFLIKTESDKNRPSPSKIEKFCKKFRYLGTYNIIDFR